MWLLLVGFTAASCAGAAKSGGAVTHMPTRGPDSKESAFSAGDLGLISGFGKIPWSRKWQPTAVFLPGKSHGQKSLADCNPWGCKKSDTTERWLTHICLRWRWVLTEKFIVFHCLVNFVFCLQFFALHSFFFFPLYWRSVLNFSMWLALQHLMNSSSWSRSSCLSTLIKSSLPFHVFNLPFSPTHPLSEGFVIWLLQSFKDPWIDFMKPTRYLELYPKIDLCVPL